MAEQWPPHHSSTTSFPLLFAHHKKKQQHNNYDFTTFGIEDYCDANPNPQFAGWLVVYQTGAAEWWCAVGNTNINNNTALLLNGTQMQ